MLASNARLNLKLNSRIQRSDAICKTYIGYNLLPAQFSRFKVLSRDILEFVHKYGISCEAFLKHARGSFDGAKKSKELKNVTAAQDIETALANRQALFKCIDWLNKLTENEVENMKARLSPTPFQARPKKKSLSDDVLNFVNGQTNDTYEAICNKAQQVSTYTNYEKAIMSMKNKQGCQCFHNLLGEDWWKDLLCLLFFSMMNRSKGVSSMNPSWVISFCQSQQEKRNKNKNGADSCLISEDDDASFKFFVDEVVKYSLEHSLQQDESLIVPNLEGKDNYYYNATEKIRSRSPKPKDDPLMVFRCLTLMYLRNVQNHNEVIDVLTEPDIEEFGDEDEFLLTDEESGDELDESAGTKRRLLNSKMAKKTATGAGTSTSKSSKSKKSNAASSGGGGNNLNHNNLNYESMSPVIGETDDSGNSTDYFAEMNRISRTKEVNSTLFQAAMLFLTLKVKISHLDIKPANQIWEGLNVKIDERKVASMKVLFGSLFPSSLWMVLEFNSLIGFSLVSCCSTTSFLPYIPNGELSGITINRMVDAVTTEGSVLPNMGPSRFLKDAKEVLKITTKEQMKEEVHRFKNAGSSPLEKALLFRMQSHCEQLFHDVISSYLSLENDATDVRPMLSAMPFSKSVLSQIEKASKERLSANMASNGFAL